MKNRVIPQPHKLKQKKQRNDAQRELEERANNHIINFTELMFPIRKGEERLNITDIPPLDILKAIVALEEFCNASFEIRYDEFLDQWTFMTAVMDKILVALNALANCLDRAKEIPPGREQLIMDSFAANLEKILPRLYELCLKRIEAGDFSSISETIKNPLNKAHFRELCQTVRSNIETVRNLRGQTSAILQLLRWPGPNSYHRAAIPNWGKCNLEKTLALVWAISNLLVTSNVQQAIQGEAKDFIYDQSLFWLGDMSVEHWAYLANLVAAPNVFMTMAEECKGVESGSESQAQIQQILSAKGEYFGDDLFLTLQPELSALLVASQFSDLGTISRVFRCPAAAQFISDQQAQRQRIADENAALVSADAEKKEQEKLERYRQLAKKRREPEKKDKFEALEEDSADEEVIESPSQELSPHRKNLHSLMLDTRIILSHKISEIKRFLQNPDLSVQDYLELYTALGQLILKQKDPKPEELNELIEILKEFSGKNNIEQSDWVRDLVSELDEKFQILIAARARVKDRKKIENPVKTVALLLPKNVPEILESLDTFWGKAYVVGGYPRNFFAKITEKTDIDILVIGCPGDFFRRADYRDLFSRQLSEKLKKRVVVKTTPLARLLIIEIEGESYDVWFSPERFLGLELRRRDLTFNTICADKNGQVRSFFKSAMEDAENRICKPVDNWKEFFKDPIRLLRLLKMTEVNAFKLEDADRKILLGELEKIRNFNPEQQASWLGSNVEGFRIILFKLLRSAIKKQLRGEGKPLSNIVMRLGARLLQTIGVDEFFRYGAFVTAYGAAQRIEEAKLGRAQAASVAAQEVSLVQAGGPQLFRVGSGAQLVAASSPAPARD